ncbi:MAG: YceH family protein [Acidobacteriota bacterium]
MPRTRPLDAVELRVLGALLEKEQTTPDHYPLTINALIAACNQKTNRDPVTALTETEVVEALDRLRLDALTWRSEGARAERWEQRLDRRWSLTPPRKAVMTLLVLRGAQTPGELKSRAERMHSFASLGEVEETLSSLAGPADDLDTLVRELPRGPGARQNRWIHLVGTDDVTAMLAAAAPAAAAPAAPAPSSSASTSPPAEALESVAHGPSALERLETLEDSVDDLITTVDILRDELDRLRSDFDALRHRLGDD